MDIKSKRKDSVQQQGESGRGLLVREDSSNQLHDILVAVYGTLKRGCGNNLLLHDSVFISEGKTKDNYPLVIGGSGLPFLAKTKGAGKKVEVEVYLVDERTLASLDMLEGHPRWYRREKIDVICTDGTVLTPWVYLAPSEYYKEGDETFESFLG
jgi:gamma-glutamylcyclotransferase (GGCT)/AIG2-like uncharacterized protein YtfP